MNFLYFKTLSISLKNKVKTTKKHTPKKKANSCHKTAEGLVLASAKRPTPDRKKAEISNIPPPPKKRLTNAKYKISKPIKPKSATSAIGA